MQKHNGLVMSSKKVAYRGVRATPVPLFSHEICAMLNLEYDDVHFDIDLETNHTSTQLGSNLYVITSLVNSSFAKCTQLQTLNTHTHTHIPTPTNTHPHPHPHPHPHV
jgi:hypothetical protein